MQLRDLPAGTQQVVPVTDLGREIARAHASHRHGSCGATSRADRRAVARREDRTEYHDPAMTDPISLATPYRTHTAGQLRAEDAGTEARSPAGSTAGATTAS